VWGNYTHTLERTGEGWKCSGMTFVVTHARGNEMARDYLPDPVLVLSFREDLL
jgi:hypothetical protein